MAYIHECDICKKRFDIDETMSEVTLISADLLREHCRLPETSADLLREDCHLPETRLELCDKCYSDLKQYVDSLVEPGCMGTLEVR